MSITKTASHARTTARKNGPGRRLVLFALLVGVMGTVIPTAVHAQGAIGAASGAAGAADAAAIERRQFWVLHVAAIHREMMATKDLENLDAQERARTIELPRTRQYFNEDIPHQAAWYQIANQASYVVPMGSVRFQFRGANVQMVDGIRWKIQDPETTHPKLVFNRFNTLHAFSGWATQLIRDPVALSLDPEGDGQASYVSAWMKGYLTRQAVLSFVDPATGNCGRHAARYVYRYIYHAPDGSTIAFFERAVETPRTSVWTGNGTPASPCTVIASEPDFYWSTKGNASLDTSSKCKPVIRWSDGSVEEFGPPITTTTDPITLEIAGSFQPACTANSGDLRHIDRNGNITIFRSGTNTQTLIDSSNRQSVLTYDTSVASGRPFSRLKTVELPSVGSAAPHRFTIQWKTVEVRFDLIWPDVVCHALDGVEQPCSWRDEAPDPSIVDLVESITIPDGRIYSFEYGPWGNLTRVIEPGGAIREYVYGGASNLDYANAAARLSSRPEPFTRKSPCAITTQTTIEPCTTMWSGEMVKVHARGMVQEKVLPGGAGPASRVCINYVTREACTPGTVGCSQVWKELTFSDGSIAKTGMVIQALRSNAPTTDTVLSIPDTFPLDQHGLVIGDEVWSGTPTAVECQSSGPSLASAIYFGNKDTGELWYESDFVKWRLSAFSLAANQRLRKTVILRDGLSVTNNMIYGNSIDIDPSPSVAEWRNTAATTESCSFADVVTAHGCSSVGATLLHRAESTYLNYFPGTFNGRNLLALPQTTKLYDWNNALLEETTTFYDGFEVTASERSATVLDSSIGLTAGSPRGNVTKVRMRVNASKSIEVQSRYFDTGDVKSVTDGEGGVTTSVHDFSLCTPGSTHTSSNINPLNHAMTILSDCMSGLPLTATDENGKKVHHQYDFLGRSVETAATGDVLTNLPRTGAQAYLRDASAPTGSGTVPGQARVTSWTQYLSLGEVGMQRVVSRTRDGSPEGAYVKVFTDGLGRTTQTRARVDPSTTEGFAEVVSTDVYDGMGRTPRSFPSCYAAASDSVTAHCSSVILSTVEYDALGRPTVVTEPGNRVTRTTYGKQDGQRLVTTVNPRGYTTKVLTSLSGETVRTEEESSLCGGFCVTTSTFDGAGRLKVVRDHVGNELSYTYDDLGRQLTMSDPDMGTWSFDYDDNVNLTQQTDARNQVIVFRYDTLNRLIVKDLPPTGATATDIGPEDVTYFYDGAGPKPPVETAVNNATFVSQSVPSTMTTGQTVEVTVTMLNTGTTTWTPAQLYRLGSQNPQDNGIWREGRVELPSSVAPGAQVTFRFNITAPSTPGPYKFQWRMVKEFVEWFGAFTPELTITVSAANNPVPTLSSINPSSVIVGIGATTLTANGSNFIAGSVVRLTGRMNVALSANGATATASSTYSSSEYPNMQLPAVNDGDRKGANIAGWMDNTQDVFPDWVEIQFNGTKTIDEIDVITRQDDAVNGIEPTLTQTFTSAGVVDFDVQYWNGAWVTVSGGNVTGNNKVWKQFTFTPVSTSRIRILVKFAKASWSRLIEVEAWSPSDTQNRPTTFVSGGQVRAEIFATDLKTAQNYSVTVFNPAPGGGTSAMVPLTVGGSRVNVARAANGATATASSTYSSSEYPNMQLPAVNDGDRKGANIAGWMDNTQDVFPDWVEIQFNGTKTIDEIDVITRQDDAVNGIEPTLTQTFTSAGVVDFDVQYWNGAWVTVSGGNVTGNNKVWKQFTFTPVSTSRIRILVKFAKASWSRLIEVEAWTPSVP